MNLFAGGSSVHQYSLFILPLCSSFHELPPIQLKPGRQEIHSSVSIQPRALSQLQQQQQQPGGACVPYTLHTDTGTFLQLLSPVLNMAPIDL